MFHSEGSQPEYAADPEDEKQRFGENTGIQSAQPIFEFLMFGSKRVLVGEIFLSQLLSSLQPLVHPQIQWALHPLVHRVWGGLRNLH